MTRPHVITDTAALAATGRALEESRRRAVAAGVKPPAPWSASVAAAVPPSDRPGRIVALAAMFGASDLAAELNARHLTVRQATALLSAATGTARVISAAGKAQVRLALAAVEHERAAESGDRNASRAKQLAALLDRHALAHTRAGVAIASSTLPMDALTQMVKARADLFGRLGPAAQAGLLRDLALTTTPHNMSDKQ